jgi:hypothetical protein
MHTVVDDELWEPWVAFLEKALGHPLEEVADVEHDIDCAGFDAGGAVCGDDPQFEVEAQGCVFFCLGRQAEMFIPLLRRPRLGKMRVEHVTVSGRFWQHLLTKENAAAIADGLERQVEEKRDEIDQAQKRLEEGLASVDGVVTPEEERAMKADQRRRNFRNN